MSLQKNEGGIYMRTQKKDKKIYGILKMKDLFLPMLKFIILPIRILSLFCSFCNEYIPLIFQDFLKILMKIYKNFVAYLSKATSSAKEQANRKKLLAIYKDTILQSVTSSSHNTQWAAFKKVTVLMMALFQAVSLVSTKLGCDFYFGNLASFAPLFIAVGIQGLMFSSAVSYSNGTRKKGVIVLLVLATVCSMISSYTGLAISSMPPNIEYQKAYNKFYDEYINLINMVQNSNSNAVDIDTSVDMLYQRIENGIRLGESYLNTIDDMIDVYEQTVSENQGIQEHEVTNTDGSVVNAEIFVTNDIGLDANEKRNALTAQKSALNRAVSQLKNIFYDADMNFKVSKEDVIADLATEENSSITREMLNIFSVYNQLANSISSTALALNSSDNIERIPDNYLEQIKKNTYYGEIINQGIQEYNDIPGIYQSANNKSITNYIIGFLRNNTGENNSFTALSARNELEVVRQYINEKYTQIQEIARLYLNSDEIEKLATVKEEFENFGDSNFMVLRALFSDQYKNYIGYAVMAVLVDGLTFLVAYIRSKSNIPFLKLMSNRDLTDCESEIFELIIRADNSFYSKGICSGKYDDISPDKFRKMCRKRVLIASQKIISFLDKFYLCPWTAQQGYTLCADFEKLDTDSFRELTALLIDLNLLKVIPKSDLEILENKYNGNDGKIKDTVTSDKKVALLKSRAHLYLRDNLAEAINFETITNNEI